MVSVGAFIGAAAVAAHDGWGVPAIGHGPSFQREPGLKIRDVLPAGPSTVAKVYWCGCRVAWLPCTERGNAAHHWDSLGTQEE